MNSKPPELSYLPALQIPFLTKLYDIILLFSGLGPRFKSRLSDLSGLAFNQTGTIVDLGCGTGTHAKLLAERYGQAQVIGLDPDIDLINKLQSTNSLSNLKFQTGFIQAIDLPDQSVDYGFSTLVFHHLLPDDKASAFREIYRVLRPGGRLFIADWGKLSFPFFRHYLYLIEDKKCIDSHFTEEFLIDSKRAGFVLKNRELVKQSGIHFWTFEKPVS